MFYIYVANMFKIFQLFQSYVAISVFMLQVTNVLSGCCIRMFHTHVASVCSKCFINTYVTFKCFILQVFHVLAVCSESHGGNAPGSCGRGVLVLIPSPGSHLHGKRGGGQGEGAAGAGWGKTNGGRVRVRGGMR